MRVVVLVALAAVYGGCAYPLETAVVARTRYAGDPAKVITAYTDCVAIDNTSWDALDACMAASGFPRGTSEDASGAPAPAMPAAGRPLPAYPQQTGRIRPIFGPAGAVEMCQDASGLPHAKPDLTYPAPGKVQFTVREENEAFITCMWRYGVKRTAERAYDWN